MKTNSPDLFTPLAAKLRPTQLECFFGQIHLLTEGKPLHQAILQGHLHSMILWGPPGTGKTTLARLIAHYANARIEAISAVLAGVKEIRTAVEQAQHARAENNQATILLIDEIHRFNKAQQDVLLPHVEEGLFTLIGATTENPSFALNNALLSRARVYVLKRLEIDDILKIIERAIKDLTETLGPIDFANQLRVQLANAADGDARQSLNLLEMAVDFAEKINGTLTITEKILADVLVNSVRRFDKGGDYFYDQISALHKSIRGSSPDAALYWLACMLTSGCDPLYLARRIVRTASEDIGNADPRALQIALNAWETQERLGSPEGELALAQAVVYLACAPKSNAVYTAFKAAMRDAKQQGTLEVPIHLRNAPTTLMQKLGYGKSYRYAHDEPDAYAAGERYFPDEIDEPHYYSPVNRGLEIKIAEKLNHLRQLDKQYTTENCKQPSKTKHKKHSETK
jgi:putative ATPase